MSFDLLDDVLAAAHQLVQWLRSPLALDEMFDLLLYEYEDHYLFLLSQCSHCHHGLLGQVYYHHHWDPLFFQQQQEVEEAYRYECCC